MPGGYFFFSNALLGPKMGSPNALDFFVLGPVYLAILTEIKIG
jgi:hypothetical protein